MDYYEGLQKLKENSLPPCFILEGKEPYLIEDFLQKVREALIPAEDASLNLTRYSGGQFDHEALQASLGTLSLFGDARLIIVRSAEDIKWSAAMKKTLKEESFEGVTLIFVVQKEKPSVRTLRSLAPSVVCERITRAQMEKWILKEAREAGKSLSGDALRSIIEGSRYYEYNSTIDLFFVKSELAKLFSTPQVNITAERVRSMLAIPLEEKVFDMLEAITEGNGHRAWELYAQLKAAGELDNVLSLFTRNYEQLLIARIYFDMSQPISTLAQTLSLRSSYIAQKIQKQSLKHSKQKILSSLELCLETLYQSRQETVELAEVIEKLILQLLHRA